MTTKEASRPAVERFLFFLWIFSAILALIMLFFNAIPLIQIGIWPDMGTHKRPYVNWSRVSVIIFSVTTLLLWVKQHPLIKDIQRFGQSRLTDAFTLKFSITLFILYIALSGCVGWVRHIALETRAFDLGIFVQAIYNTLHGKFLFSSIKENICLLGDHVSPLLVLITPVFVLWQDPRVLLLLQVVASAAGILCIRKIAADKLKDPLLVLVFVLLYFFYYPTRAALHEDFHPEVIAEPFIFMSFIFMHRRRYWAMLLSLAVVASAKENMFGIIFALGFYQWIFLKEKKWGLGLMSASILLFLWEMIWVVPHFSGAQSLYLNSYGGLFSTNSGALKIFTDGDRWEYLFKVFLPFLFLPFFHLPTFILTLPVLLQNFLSQNDTMRSVNYHYYTGLTPFLFISAIYGFSSLCLKNKWIERYKIQLALILLLIGILRSGPSEYYFFWSSQRNITEHSRLIRDHLRHIPDSETVLTHNNLIPQVANRYKVYQFEYNAKPTKREQALKYDADIIILEKSFWEPESLPLDRSLTELTEAGYQIEFEHDGFYLLRKTPGA